MFCCVYMFICLIIQSHLVCAFQREQQTAGPQLSALGQLLTRACISETGTHTFHVLFDDKTSPQPLDPSTHLMPTWELQASMTHSDMFTDLVLLSRLQRTLGCFPPQPREPLVCPGGCQPALRVGLATMSPQIILSLPSGILFSAVTQLPMDM